jgi:ABC-type phosphate transport system substrate-binding protein
MARLLLGIAIFAWLVVPGDARAEGLLIIANPNLIVATPVPLSQIAAIYLLRVTSWPDGSHIVPVNREAGSRAREEFTQQVLQEDNAGLAIYWNEMHFQGKMPPVVQESEEAMIAFIRNVPGSIGYINGSAPRPDVAPRLDVKVIAYVP